MEVWLLCVCAHIKWKCEWNTSHNIRKFESLRFLPCLSTVAGAWKMCLRISFTLALSPPLSLSLSHSIYLLLSPYSLFNYYFFFAFQFTCMTFCVLEIVNVRIMYARNMRKIHDSIAHIHYSHTEYPKKALKWKMKRENKNRNPLQSTQQLWCCSLFACFQFQFQFRIFHSLSHGFASCSCCCCFSLAFFPTWLFSFVCHSIK